MKYFVFCAGTRQCKWDEGQRNFYSSIRRTRLQFRHIYENMDAGFAKIRSIISIELDDCLITSVGLSYLNNVKNLYLKGMMIKDEDFIHLQNVYRLELESIAITDEGWT